MFHTCSYKGANMLGDFVPQEMMPSLGRCLGKKRYIYVCLGICVCGGRIEFNFLLCIHTRVGLK
jgi:hypothetical protein